ncbi:MAG: hypothetical protein JNL90_04590 [Planctomycetes bacterium]|nr:hypothetical protein [Planctomycetota bacterium]
MRGASRLSLALALIAVPSVTVPSVAASAPPATAARAAATARRDERQLAIDARAAPQRCDLRFTLGEEGRSDLAIELRAGPAAPLRRLTLRFEPFEGARWHWTVRAADAPDDRLFDAAGRSTTATPLTHFPEPEGLAYALRFTFHAGGGLTVAALDGTPLLVTTEPAGAPLTLHVASSGAVNDLALTALADDAAAPASAPLAAALRDFDARAAAPAAPAAPAESFAAPPPAPGFFVAEFAPRGVPPLFAVRPVDRRVAPEGELERLILEVRPDVEVATLLARPKVPARGGAAATRITLLACGAPLGKSEPSALALQAALLAEGEPLVAVDFLGGGERRMNASFDSLDDPELRLVGSSPAEVAADEIAQLLTWLATRPEATDRTARLLLDGAAAAALARCGAAVCTPLTEPAAATAVGGAAASATLADAAVFGEEYLRARYDSDLLHFALARQEHLETPDRAQPLLERMGRLEPPNLSLDGALHFSPASGVAPLRADGDGGQRFGLLALSDFGPRAALHLAVQELAPLPADLALVGFGGPLESLDRAVQQVLTLASAAPGGANGAARPIRCRVVAEGAWGVVALLAATHRPELFESLVVRDAPPSFELLLRRPLDAVRAPPRFALLSQGAPLPLYVERALARFELEECVLALRAAGVAVEWRAPVDALRRPLSRHQRLSMWPRVRRLDLKPR